MIIRLRILIQELWKMKVGWDEPLEEETIEAWGTLAEDSAGLVNHTIPRYIGYSGEDSSYDAPQW